MAVERCWRRMVHRAQVPKDGLRGASPGRFDIGIPKPEDLECLKPQPLVAFECGRNKKAFDLLRHLEAAKKHDGPNPADITKLAREVSHKGLSYGYALEFYDEDHGEAKQEFLVIRVCRPVPDVLRRLQISIATVPGSSVYGLPQVPLAVLQALFECV